MSTLLDAWINIIYNISTKFYHFHYFSSILLNTNVFSGQFLHIKAINVPGQFCDKPEKTKGSVKEIFVIFFENFDLLFKMLTK